MAVLTSYDVHIPAKVIGEVSEAMGYGDLLSAAADTVMSASEYLTTHDVEAGINEPLGYGLDPGESQGIWLANEMEAEMFITDEFNSTHYLFVSLALNDRNILFTTPHVLCTLANHAVLENGYVTAALTYYIETKDGDHEYIECLRDNYLHR